jgi:hypothetical protein
LQKDSNKKSKKEIGIEERVKKLNIPCEWWNDEALEDSERVRDENLGLIEWAQRKDSMGF